MRISSPLYSLSVLVLISLFSPMSNSQTISNTGYTQLYTYQTNPFFRVVNQTLYSAYPSYLRQTTVSSVYVQGDAETLSIVISYAQSSGGLYRATVNYSIRTKQLRIVSFGPVVATNRVTTTNSSVVIHNDPGIAIRLGTPPS